MKTRIALALLLSSALPAQILLIKDLDPRSRKSSNPDFTAGVEVGGYLYFPATNELGRELWSTDGKAGGTRLFADVLVGAGSGNPEYLCRHDGQLFFASYAAWKGRELCVTDGTKAGTRVLDIYPGTTSSTPRYMTSFAGKVFMQCANTLMWTDGTLKGTKTLKDSQDRTRLVGAGEFTPLSNGRMLFAANGVSYRQGQELWTTDGTEKGATLVKDIVAGSGSSTPRLLTVVGGLVFFSARDRLAVNRLWVTNGSAGGTRQVDTVQTSPRDLIAVGNTLFYTAYEPATGRQLYATTGAQGKRLTNFAQFPTTWSAAALGSKLVFGGFPSRTSPLVPMISDGTLLGTKQLHTATFPAAFTTVGSRYVFFSAQHPTKGQELWKTNGTVTGTVLVDDVVKGIGSFYPSHIRPLRNRLLMRGYRGDVGYEMFGGLLGAVADNDYRDGCASVPQRHGELRIGDPVLGSTVSIFLDHWHQGSLTAMLGFGLPVRRPNRVGMCPLWVDERTMYVSRMNLSGSRGWLTATLPNDASLIGQGFVIQAAIGDAKQVLSLSNASQAFFGR